MGKFSWEIIAEKDALIAELERKLMSENAHIESIRQQLDAKDAKIFERNSVISTKDAQLKIACDALEFIKRRVLVGWEVRKEYIDTKLQEIEALKQIGAGNE